MLRKPIFTGAVSVLMILVLAGCNLPRRQSVWARTTTPTHAFSAIDTLSPPATPEPAATPTTHPSLCDHPYQPSSEGSTWVYAGENSSTGDYARTDTVTGRRDRAFSIQTEIAGISSTVDYACNEAGLVVGDPIQQYLGTLLAIPGSQVEVKLVSASGVSLPADLTPGDTWQQQAEWQVSSPDLSTSGRSDFDYTAVGYERITVPYGTFDAVRVETTVSVDVSPLRLPLGTYTLTTWMAPGVGIIKSEGASHIRGVNFSDRLELVSFTPSP